MTTTKLPHDMDRPRDHDARMAVVRRWAQWHLGDPSYGNEVLAAYLYPRTVAAALDAEYDA